MATTWNKTINSDNGNWMVNFNIASKDPADVTLAQTFGDLTLDFSGAYVDPIDSTFTFTIPKKISLRDSWNPHYNSHDPLDDHLGNDPEYRNILLNPLPNAAFIYNFNDASVLSATRYRQAVIFADAVEAGISTALLALRNATVILPVNTTFTV